MTKEEVCYSTPRNVFSAVHPVFTATHPVFPAKAGIQKIPVKSKLPYKFADLSNFQSIVSTHPSFVFLLHPLGRIAADLQPFPLGRERPTNRIVGS